MTSVVTPEHRLARVVRRHPVASFLAWSAGVGQSIAFLPVIARDHGVEVVTARSSSRPTWSACCCRPW